MEILFKSNNKIFFIEVDELDWNYIEVIGGKFNNVPHINELPILYHIIDNTFKYPVYYEYKNRALIKSINGNDAFDVITFEEKDKDYTQVNINNIINGNII